MDHRPPGPAAGLPAVRLRPRAQPGRGHPVQPATKLFNVTVRGIDELTGLIKNRLKPPQDRPDLLNGFITQTGLMISGPP